MAGLPIVLLVHGMGTHPLDNMTKEFKAGLSEAAKGFNIKDFEIDEHMELVEFNYSETLDQIRKKLAGEAQGILDQFDVLPGNSLIERLLSFQANLDEDEFIYTHWLDVLLYGASYYGEAIRVELARKINMLLKRAHGADVHIIAHSLGTAVVHDTLEKLYRRDATPGDGIPDLKPNIDSIKCLWTFANVSGMVDILNCVTPSDTVVRAGPKGCTHYFYNIRHELDPFTWFEQYDPQPPAAQTFVNNVVRKQNTHSFQEYVADPEVAQYLLLHLTDLQAPKLTENLNHCIEKHRETSINGLYEKIEAETSDIRDGDVNSIPELMEAINAFVEKVKLLTGEDGE
jgi:hypothetical protein